MIQLITAINPQSQKYNLDKNTLEKWILENALYKNTIENTFQKIYFGKRETQLIIAINPRTAC